ncbi:MAG: hypothetical protein QG628_671 [Patescibacteria group bacterium]|jgi:hypothetical protein|nr:hypothetical protein [Patescibacteria group bacterium]
MTNIAVRIYNFAEQLPAAPERTAFYTGLIGVIDGMYHIEFGNPIVGGSLAILGAVAIGASLNTERAHNVLDSSNSP